MGIVHHANYVHYLEEARIYFLKENGFSYAELEKRGIFSPISHLDVSYKVPCTYGDTIEVEIKLIKATPVRFTFKYIIKNEKTKDVIAIAESEHCFSDANGKLLILSRVDKEMSERFSSLVESEEN